MNKYQNEKYGHGAIPEFEEVEFFILFGAIFLEIENCSQNDYFDSGRQWNIDIEVTETKQTLEKWGDLT